MEYGLVSIIPAVILILFALKTRRTFEALIIGSLVTYIIIEGPGFLGAWTDSLFEVLTDYDVQWVIIVCGLFGSLIALLEASRGTLSFTEKMASVCKSAKSSLVVTWIMGILIFIDDYLNIITLGTCMCPLTDRYKEPREATSYVIDSTAAPVCVLLPISTWSIFYASMFYARPEIASLGFTSQTSMYISLIPYIFYPIFTEIIVLLFCLKLLPKVGRMKKAYARMEKMPQVQIKESGNEVNSGKGTIWDFLIPILVLVIITLVNGEILIGLITALAVCLVLFLPRRLVSFGEFCDSFMKGFCNMIPTLAVLVAAFLMQQAAQDIGLPQYIISVAEPLMNAALFPAVTFLAVSLLTFVTGSNWGIPAACVPIVIPLASAVGANMILTMAAIVSAGTFGSHACFYSDATVMTSAACEMENMDHALSQLPYAMFGAALSLAAFLICGYVGL